MHLSHVTSKIKSGRKRKVIFWNVGYWLQKRPSNYSYLMILFSVYVHNESNTYKLLVLVKKATGLAKKLKNQHYVGTRTWLGHFTTAAPGGGYSRCRATPVLHSGQPSTLSKSESCSKFAQEFSQLSWDFATFSQQSYTLLLCQNCVKSGQWNYVSIFLATDAKVYSKLPSDVLFTVHYFLLIP